MFIYFILSLIINYSQHMNNVFECPNIDFSLTKMIYKLDYIISSLIETTSSIDAVLFLK